jgi:hypothetical protein
VFEETRTKLTRLRLNEYNEDWGFGCVDNLGT